MLVHTKKYEINKKKILILVQNIIIKLKRA